VIIVEGEFHKVTRHSKKKEQIWIETDDEDIQDTDEDVQGADGGVQDADEDVQDADEDAGSSGSDFQPSPNSGAENGDTLDYMDSKTPDKDYNPDANMESEAAQDHDVDNELEDAGTDIITSGTGSKKQKQGVVGRKEIQKIRNLNQMPSLSSSDEHVEIVSGQKRKAAQIQKHEYLLP
jgi:hypothetical protein